MAAASWGFSRVNGLLGQKQMNGSSYVKRRYTGRTLDRRSLIATGIHHNRGLICFRNIFRYDSLEDGEQSIQPPFVERDIHRIENKSHVSMYVTE